MYVVAIRSNATGEIRRVEVEDEWRPGDERQWLEDAAGARKRSLFLQGAAGHPNSGGGGEADKPSFMALYVDLPNGSRIPLEQERVGPLTPASGA